jgi:hypothetical protein
MMVKNCCTCNDAIHVLVSATTTRIYMPERSVLSALIWKQPNNLNIDGAGATGDPQHKNRGRIAKRRTFDGGDEA